MGWKPQAFTCACVSLSGMNYSRPWPLGTYKGCVSHWKQSWGDLGCHLFGGSGFTEAKATPYAQLQGLYINHREWLDAGLTICVYLASHSPWVSVSSFVTLTWRFRGLGLASNFSCISPVVKGYPAGTRGGTRDVNCPQGRDLGLGGWAGRANRAVCLSKEGSLQ